MVGVNCLTAGKGDTQNLKKGERSVSILHTGSGQARVAKYKTKVTNGA